MGRGQNWRTEMYGIPPPVSAARRPDLQEDVRNLKATTACDLFVEKGRRPRREVVGLLRTLRIHAEPQDDELLRADRNTGMAHISVSAFGTVMVFRVPDDADMSGFGFAGIASRADAQKQLDRYLESRGYKPDDSYQW